MQMNSDDTHTVEAFDKLYQEVFTDNNNWSRRQNKKALSELALKIPNKQKAQAQYASLYKEYACTPDYAIVVDGLISTLNNAPHACKESSVSAMWTLYEKYTCDPLLKDRLISAYLKRRKFFQQQAQENTPLWNDFITTAKETLFRKRQTLLLKYVPMVISIILLSVVIYEIGFS
jgi:hypothetical protein